MSSSMRQGNQIDLRTQGGSRQVTLTPGTSGQWIFDAQQARIGASSTKPGLYNNVRCLMIEGLATIVRSSGGTTPIYADQFYRAISSIGLTCPMFGTLIDPSITSGIVAKELLEYYGTGYARPGVNRQPIPGADGTYVRPFELMIPFAQGLNPNPDHMDLWLGWLDEGILELFLESSATPFGISGVTITSVAMNVAIETVPCSELIIPPYVQLRRYQQAASASSNGPKLTNVGDAGALQGTDDASRLEAMLFSHQTGGFIGSGTADQISGITMPWRDQAQSTLPQFFFQRFLRAGKMARLGFDPAVVAVFDNTPPYSMSANPSSTGRLNDASARYTPLVWQEKGGLISYMQKVKGNYPLDGMTFGSTQTGSFTVYTREWKQFSLSKCSELLAAAGIDPGTVDLVPKLAKKNVKPIMADKVFCFPRGVQGKVAKKAA